MMLRSFSLLVLFLGAASASQQDVLIAEGNPHMQGAEATCGKTKEGVCSMEDVKAFDTCRCPCQNLMLGANQAALITQPLAVQGDTFQGKEMVRVGPGLEVPIYKFKQPGRLSPAQLPFKVLPLRTIDPTGLYIFNVPTNHAMDSWFPGYSWSVLMCKNCPATEQHLGWRFTRNDNPAEEFYALIVEVVPGQQERVNAERTPGSILEISAFRVIGQPLAALGLAASMFTKL